jgi:hypothetical protein
MADSDTRKITSMAEYVSTLLTDGARDLRAGRPIDGQHIMDIVNPMMGLAERLGLPVQRVAALIAAALDCAASEPVTVNGYADVAEILVAAKSMLRRACGLPVF